MTNAGVNTINCVEKACAERESGKIAYQWQHLFFNVSPLHSVRECRLVSWQMRV